MPPEWRTTWRPSCLHNPLVRRTKPADFTLFAWVDESVIVGDGLLPGSYTLAAVVADAADLERLREDLKALTGKGVVRLHWNAESDKRRDQIAQAAAALDIAAIVVVGAPVHRLKQERARRCCLELLLYELDQFGVSRVWLESRAPAQDQRDRRLVDSARGKGLISRELPIDFARPLQESMLWLPDVVAGAATSAALGEPRWLLAMSEIVTIHRVIVR
ncbi:hypothetical protein EV643_101305 [Kribbella sp. VKM Ac-2527]|uniref:DUF3800 domain-containing protein n=1 Tax=Kribbella caucasensis TaxID=2512215 RepID=A0A4R6KPC3_9ACTN|nr:hypothetical protein EV643_101305 [Kribbella sp. VKM Ac-2527]